MLGFQGNWCGRGRLPGGGRRRAAVEDAGIAVVDGAKLARAEGGRVLSGDDDVVVSLLGSIVAVAVDGIQPLNRIKPTRPKTTSILCDTATPH